MKTLLLALCSVVSILSFPSEQFKDAQALGSEKYRKQAVLYQKHVVNGKIKDQSSRFFPKLNEEGEQLRKLNFDRCRIGMDQYLQSQQLKKVVLNDAQYRFALVVNDRWEQSDQEGVLEMAQCYFAAGDARVRLSIPVYRDQKRLLIWKSTEPMFEQPIVPLSYF